jgi:hypothetical protein
MGLDPTNPDGEIWSSAEKKRATRARYGPYPKPNVCPVPRKMRDIPQTKHGYPVPWVSDWTGTDGAPSRYVPVPGHPEWGDYNASEAGIGEGYPLAGLLHPARQMRGMLERRCGVCGKHIPGTKILIGGPPLLRVGFHEPPVHRECARYAVQACPGINHGRIIVVEARNYTCKPLWGDAEGNTYSEKPLLRLPVVAVAAFAPQNAVVYTEGAWANWTHTPAHPDLGGWPTWDLNDLSTHPDAVAKERE